MKPVESFWGMVEVGSYVRDRSEYALVWRVDRLDDTRAMLWRPDRDAVVIPRPPASRDVTILMPTMEEAVATIQDSLGGATVVATQEQPGGAYHCPPFVINPRARRHQEARDHLWIIHGIYTEDIKSGAGLSEAHDDSHADPDLRAVRPHVHRES